MPQLDGNSLVLITRPNMKAKVDRKQSDYRKYDDTHAKYIEFQRGDNVYVYNSADRNSIWIPGTIPKPMGPVSYEVFLDKIKYKLDNQL